ncbi:hypothetical protein PIB12_14960 [Klebsiella pasteurii]|nr:hypothetical protein [Klebsiella pasteurii]MDD9652821.1 hypothetical protein [Klebsiella pasteurii]
MDREHLLKWNISWCGLSAAWSLVSNGDVSTTSKGAELAIIALEQ